jgi:hypothetical protein
MILGFFWLLLLGIENFCLKYLALTGHSDDQASKPGFERTRDFQNKKLQTTDS